MFEYIDSLLVIGQELQILIGQGQLELLNIHLDQFAFVQDLILYRETWLANCDLEMYVYDLHAPKSLRKAGSS